MTGKKKKSSLHTRWQTLPAGLRTAAGWLFGWGVCCAAAVLAVYYWRVFYSYDRFPALWLTAAAVGVVSVLYFSVRCVLRFVPTLAGKAALLLVLAGLGFCFGDPPMQVPDEQGHFLREYAISMGRFDFDAERSYPGDVTLLVRDFPGAYTNGNDGAALKQYCHLADENDPNGLKLPDGPVLSVSDCFAAYRADVAAWRQTGVEPEDPVKEPLVVMLIPYLVGALGMAAVRTLGGGALACLYAGRVCGLLRYALLAYLALRGQKRWRGAFLSVLFLPLALFMAGSLNYDAILLGLYAVAASLLLREEFGKKQMTGFVICVALINTIKPWINLLWIPGLLFLDKKNRRTRLGPWGSMAVTLAASLAATALTSGYGRLARHNYGVVARMLGGTVSTLDQLKFCLANPLRTAAVLWGTLFENEFFLSGFGDFGALDTHIPVVAWCSVLLLALGVIHDVSEKPLSVRTNLGLGLFGAVYTVGVMAAMYLTYTPVGMVRVIGLQARYFLPALGCGMVLLAQVIGNTLRRSGHVLERRASAAAERSPMLLTGFAVGALGALLLFVTYFIGPVTWTVITLPV